MNINRHNYETFFLLYVDKELSAAERKAVDLFVTENPDLRMELVLLQQTVITTDDIVLEKKDCLYMEEAASALQENLLLYADEELSSTDKKAVEALLQSNTAARAEWDILRQTKLQADTSIVFEDKQSLYRKESGRVAGFRWLRVAAAVLLLATAIWTGVAVTKNYYKSNADETGSMVKQNQATQEKSSSQFSVDDNNTIATEPVESKMPENNIEATTVSKNKTDQVIDKTIPVADKKNSQYVTIPNAHNTVAAVNNNSKAPEKNIANPYSDNFNNTGSNKTIIATVTPENNNRTVSGDNSAVVKNNTKENTNNSYPNKDKTDPNAIATLVVNTKTNDVANNRRDPKLEAGTQKKKTPGGFFRKLKNALENPPTIKLVDGVKIGQVEIALK